MSTITPTLLLLALAATVCAIFASQACSKSNRA